MRRFIARRPSPAMAIAFVALLAALSGTAVALPGTGRVDSGDIRNNAIRTGDLRNNDVRGKDIRNSTIGGRDVARNTLTGADIAEARLGKVPSAGTADTATNSVNAANAGNAGSVGGIRVVRIAPFSLGNGESREVLKHGPFTFTARCRINFDPDGGGGNPARDDAQIEVDTSADNTSVQGDNSDADFDAADPVVVFTDEEATPVGTPAFDHADDAAASAPGAEVVGEVNIGLNTFGETGRCRFGGFFSVS